MYQDIIFEKALDERKEENFVALKGEVKNVEKVIEKLLTKLLECTSSVTERDFNVCGI